ncbi:MAG: hypothetical protein ACXAEN_11890 [Candidatus Thorarchaeota archaeon]
MRKTLAALLTLALFFVMAISGAEGCLSVRGVNSPAHEELTFFERSSSSSSQLILSWTSRENSTPTPMENGSIAVGDHVLLNATFQPHLNVTKVMITLSAVDGRNWTVESNGSSLTHDTYYLGNNMTVNLNVTGHTSHQIYHCIFSSLTFKNYFAPELSTLSIEEFGSLFTIVWECEDRNSEDEHFFDVYITADGGLTWQLMSGHIRESVFLWDSMGWLEQQYRVRVIAYDNDPVLNPEPRPRSYWLGLTDEVESIAFDAGHYHGQIDFTTYLEGPANVTYYEGTTENHIYFGVRALYSRYYYEIIIGNLVLTSSYWRPVFGQTNLVVNIDGLPVGTHLAELKLYVVPTSGFTEVASHEFTVEVLPRPPPGLEVIVLSFGLGGFGSLVGLLLVFAAMKRRISVS